MQMKAIGSVMFAAGLLVVSAAGVTADKAEAVAPAAAGGKVCQLEIEANDLMQYDKKKLKVAGDGAQVELTLKHTGTLAGGDNDGPQLGPRKGRGRSGHR
jgi:hypothetical protein